MANVTSIQTITKDTTAFQSAPSENHGQSGLLAADSGAYVFMGIDIPANWTDQTRLQTATLRIKAQNNVTTALTRYSVNGAWSEDTLTWANKPATGGISATVPSRAYVANQFYDIDVKSLIQAIIGGTAPNNGMLLVGGSSRLVFFSGENTDGSAPTLTMVYDEPSVSVTVGADPLRGNGSMPEATAQTIQVNLQAFQDYNYASSISTDNQFLDLQRAVGASQTVNFGLQFPNRVGYVNKAVLVLDLFDKLGTTGTATVKVSYPSQTANMIPKPAVVTNTFTSVAADDLGLVRIPLDTTFFNDAVQGVKLFVDITVSGSSGAQVNRRFRGVTAATGTKPYVEMLIESTPVNTNAQPMLGNGTMPMPAVSTTINASVNAAPMVGNGRMVMPVVSTAGNASVVATPARGSGTLVDPSVETISNYTANANVLNGSGQLIMPTVTAESIPDATVIADTMTGFGILADPQVAAEYSVSTAADAMIGTGAMPDAVVDFRTSVKVEADAMKGGGLLKTPPRINGIDISYLDDPYYALNLSLTDADDIWFRFTENTGVSTIKSERGAFTGTLTGTPTFVQGYGQHKAMSFDGIDDAILSDVGDYGRGSLEFYIRTDSKNQVVLAGGGYYGSDRRADGTPGVIGSTEPLRGMNVEIINGKVVLRNYYEFRGQVDTSVITGIKDIADGKWHQVVISNWWYSDNGDIGTTTSYDRVIDYINQDGGPGTTIFVDGTVDVHSRGTQAIARPDTIGKVGNRYFKGELSELVSRFQLTISKYSIEQLKYAFFEDEPVRAEIMRGSGAMGNARGKGNTKRVLALYHRNRGGVPGFGLEGYNPVAYYGVDKDWTVSATNEIVYGGIGSGYNPFAGGINDAVNGIPDAKFYFQSVFRKDLSEPFRDSVTDEPRYIDLQKDIDVADFDAIIFMDYPGVNYEVSDIPRRNRGRAHDDFMESVKKAVFDKGTSLYITHPQLAKDLGIVNNWTKEIPYRDSVTIPSITSGLDYIPGPYQTKGGDYQAAYNNPFVNPYVATGDVKARAAFAASTKIGWDRHWESHIKNRHRIAANIEGITNLPGYTVAETVHYYIAELDYLYGTRSATRMDANPSGVALGQEFIFDGPLGSVARGVGIEGDPTNYYLISYAPEEINVGTVLTKQQQYIDDRFEHKLNPQREYATTIVVQPGQVLAGREIKGRIVIDHNDTATYNKSTYIQNPDDLDTPKNIWRENENAETRKWQVSDWRVKLRPQTVSVSRTKVLQGKDGTSVLQTETSTYQTNELVDAPGYIEVRYMSMPERLWSYALNNVADAGDGNALVIAPPMTGAGEMPTAAVGTVQNAVVSVSPMVGRGELSKVREDINGDTQVFPFPMIGSGKMLNSGTTVKAEPMTGSGEMVELFGEIYDPQDVIYLTVFRPGKITLTRNGENN